MEQTYVRTNVCSPEQAFADGEKVTPYGVTIATPHRCTCWRWLRVSQGVRSVSAVSSWMDDAACRGRNTDLFFPVKGTASGKALQQIERAKSICRSCPVLKQCLEYVFTELPRYEDDYGIYAATTPEDRHRAFFEQRAARQRERRRQNDLKKLA